MTGISYPQEEAMHRFTFFTNHALALITIAENPKIRMRDIADKIGITERAVQRIVDDLSSAGYIAVVKDGRRNCYQIRRDCKLRDPLTEDLQIGRLIEMLIPKSAPEESLADPAYG